MAEIVATPGVLSGQPRLEGERVAVLDIVEMLEAGYSVDETARELELTADEIRTATEYYRKHRQEFAEWKREREEVTGRSGPAEV
ncbi:MAG: DUF433 domain-containing protein [Halobacteriaceae archaeon]